MIQTTLGILDFTLVPIVIGGNDRLSLEPILVAHINGLILRAVHVSILSPDDPAPVEAS